MTDPHSTLGVGRDATLNEIKRAFRKLAKEFHPDRNGGDTTAADKLRDVIAAYELLTDPEKRAAHERNAQGAWKGAGWGAGADVVFDKEFGSGDTMADLVGDIAGNRRGRGGTSMIIPGEDLAEDVSVTFVEAATGTVRRKTLMNYRTVDIIIPPGTADGATLTIPGFGMPGFGGAPAGNLNVMVAVEADAELRRDGFDVRMDLKITPAAASQGRRVVVRTIGGDIGLQIPPGARNGDVFTLEGMGIRDSVSGRRGNQYVTLVVDG